ncbi:MAG: dockerin type I domain-containing protein, partial [Planctomycetes bacterium]|nr:dockerin type I domain-containing protein [Planctomycetota bacterium]
MSHTRRSVFGRPRRQQKRGETAARSRRRLVNLERLEDRVLLAADTNPWHNNLIPNDVNGDYQVGPLDALLVINALNQGGSRRLGDLLASNAGEAESPVAEGEAASNLMFDVNDDAYLSPIDALNVINSLNEGEDPIKLVKAEARLTQNIPSNGSTPVNRPIVTSANPGDTFLLNVYVEDIRTDDGVFRDSNNDGVDDSDEFGVFAYYADVMFDSDAFVVPSGTSQVPPGLPSFNFPVSYRNPEHYQSFGDLETERYNFGNGLSGSLVKDGTGKQTGLIDEIGGFSGRLGPIGRQLPGVPAD